MMVTHIAARTDAKRPAWLLILTLPVFIGYLAVAGATIAREADGSSAELTPAQLSHLGVWWMALHVLWIAPSVLAAIGLAWLARRWRLRNTAAVLVFACTALVLAAAYVVVQAFAFGFDGATWGDSRLYPLGVMLSLAVGWAGTLPATVLVAVAVAGRGIARKTAWTVAALLCLYFGFELLTYLPVLLGPATFAETAGLPPFLLGVLWAGLGGGLLRGGVPSGA